MAQISRFKLPFCPACGSECVHTDTRGAGSKLSFDAQVHCLECDWDSVFRVNFVPTKAKHLSVNATYKGIDEKGVVRFDADGPMTEESS